MSFLDSIVKHLRKLEPIKICSCGNRFYALPSEAREWIDEGVLIGHVWECSCKSTMFLICPLFKRHSLLRKA